MYRVDEENPQLIDAGPTGASVWGSNRGLSGLRRMQWVVLDLAHKRGADSGPRPPRVINHWRGSRSWQCPCLTPSTTLRAGWHTTRTMPRISYRRLISKVYAV